MSHTPQSRTRQGKRPKARAGPCKILIRPTRSSRSDIGRGGGTHPTMVCPSKQMSTMPKRPYQITWPPAERDAAPNPAVLPELPLVRAPAVDEHQVIRLLLHALPSSLLGPAQRAHTTPRTLIKLESPRLNDGRRPGGAAAMVARETPSSCDSADILKAGQGRGEGNMFRDMPNSGDCTGNDPAWPCLLPTY